MSYYSGFVLAVPNDQKQAYIDHSRKSWPVFKRLGAKRMVEAWGDDVPHGKQTDFYRATQAKENETPLFSWFEWPDRATADAAFAKMGEQPEFQDMPAPPFDGKRMFWGGFTPIVENGTSGTGNYIQGFVLAAPAAKKQAYIDMAKSAAEMFTKHGAKFQIECWGEDVPHGKTTDFYRATEAREGEVPLFSWIEWPDRATCDKAAREMEADMADFDMTNMPFDGKRMFWGGFNAIVDES